MRRYGFNKKGAAFVLGGLSIFLIGATPSLSVFSFGEKKKPTGEVKRLDLMQQVTVAGMLIPNRRSVISPPYSGYIQRVYVNIGQMVKAGDPVIAITQTARGEGEEIHPLRAPISGKVVQILHREGEYVEMNKDLSSSMVRIDDLSHYFLSCDVPESDIGKIRVGQDVVIKANSILDRPYKGIIREMGLAAKEKKEWSRSGDRVEFDVRVEVVNPDEKLRPGMSAIVDIITQKRESTLALPHEYVEKKGKDYFVTMASGERRQVEVGLQNEEYLEVTKGLKENEEVKMVDFGALPDGGKG